MTAFRILLASFLISITCSSLAQARDQRQQLRPGVLYIYEEQQDPPQRVYAVVIERERSGAEIDVAGGGPDPDGEGKWQTVLKPVPTIAKNEGFDIAVNGDFFAYLGGKDAEGPEAQKLFKNGTPATVSGAAVSDGKAWSKPDNGRPAFVVRKDGSLDIVASRKIPQDTEEAVAGDHVIVSKGKATETPETGHGKVRHPRTAVGFKDGGKTLVLVVVDGRKPGVAVGMNFQELAAVMVKLGCEEAVNLDGGGSSTMVFRDRRENELQVMNDPSDGRPRSVANARA